MKKIPLLFLQVVLVLIGSGILVFMLWEPHFEGRNVNATPFEIYFKDPFLVYVYMGSIPFFVALYKAFKVLRYIGQDKVFSEATVDAVRTIKHCAFITAGAIVGADTYLFIFVSGNDDLAGVIMLSFIAIFISLIVGAAAVVCERILRNAQLPHTSYMPDKHSEN